MKMLPFLVSGFALLLALLAHATLAEAPRPDDADTSRRDGRPGCEVVKR